MPGEFVASPCHPITSDPPTTPSLTTTTTTESALEDTSSSQAPSKRSSMRATLSKAVHALTPSRKDKEALPGSEEEFDKQKKEEVEAQRRKDEYASYGLGAKGLGKGGVQPSG
ncbi:hypothetical protein BS50DRAFT_591500 [Corynespora cassiicola Philippines]|uniref:Uncharacterized protein n=1 Tax=Corynespora cassiicola Philippines TaxID=1448308 RepID=A0A2T2ND80_CORCC|nr:hypothetical protein BS50DRAFT_591500 [Corynespora cassiicola Philippines]